MKPACKMKPAWDKTQSGDRDFDCESEMLPGFYALVDQGLKDGWAEEEVANALLSLAQNYALKLLDRAVIDIPPGAGLH